MERFWIDPKPRYRSMTYTLYGIKAWDTVYVLDFPMQINVLR